VRVEVPRTRAESKVPARRLRRFGGWLAALLADDGVGSRFAAERHRDQGLVRRVESRNRP
jgi:hypothetical protein